MYKEYNSTIKTIKSNDRQFFIIDGMMMTPRAGLLISNECPDRYKMIIAECINRGWVEPVANISEREYIFLGLTNQ
jgi:hypothetical protein